MYSAYGDSYDVITVNNLMYHYKNWNNNVCILQRTCVNVTNLSKSEYRLRNEILVATHQNVTAVSIITPT